MPLLDRAYTTIDKGDWGPGEWQHEPDKIQWVDEETDLDCLIVRGPSGALCGYVGVPPEHACHGAHYDRIRVRDEDGDQDWPDVHGGLTYADICQEGDDESVGICHVPLEGRSADVWWLGFDCAHSGDICPRHEATNREYGLPSLSSCMPFPSSYRTVAYVRRQVQALARQLVGAYTVIESE